MGTTRTEFINAVIQCRTATELLRQFLDEMEADRQLYDAAMTVMQDPDGDGA